MADRGHRELSGAAAALHFGLSISARQNYMRAIPFTRPTMLAAAELLGGHNQGAFNQMVLRLGLEGDIPFNAGLSRTWKCGLLGKIVVERPEAVVETTEGSITLAEAVVREAIQLPQSEPAFPIQTAFARGLARDGWVLSWDENGQNPTCPSPTMKFVNSSKTSSSRLR
jgi:hypothetical protein